ncbi:MAG: hypothetical protein CM1200mP37_4220 [Chloroflexota bacterium]|nr:MAG: hypothetical protein CM1200mP37_4220 [Chloroflexota bacterium]
MWYFVNNIFRVCHFGYNSSIRSTGFFERKYGFVEWVKKYSPKDELLFTVLSQNTTDLNSAKAFQNLINAFGTPEGMHVNQFNQLLIKFV